MKLFHLIFYLQWQEQFASAFSVCLLFTLIKFPIHEKISIFATVVAMLYSCAKSNLNELPDVSSDTGLYIEIDDCLALEAGVNQIMSDLIQMDFYSQTVTKGDPNESEIGNLMHNVCGVMNPYAYTFIDRCG